MSDDSASRVPTTRKLSLGDRIRTLANQLRQEDDVQIKATSRILGAAAQLAENHDRLIDEVVEMVEDDLDRAVHPSPPKPYTVAQLQHQFESLKAAKEHFNVKARGWADLVDKLNDQYSTGSAEQSPAVTPPPSAPRSTSKQASDDGVSQRLERRLESIEQELQSLRGEMHRVVQLLERLVTHSR